MSQNFCSNCQRATRFGRRYSWGTLIMVIVTQLWWILAMPFYPRRCKVCGIKLVDSAKRRDTQLQTDLGQSIHIVNNLIGNRIYIHDMPKIRQAYKDIPVYKPLIEMKPQQQVRGPRLWRTEDYEK